MVLKKVYDLCHGAATVSSELAADPSMAPSAARHKLYGHTGGNEAHKGDMFRDKATDEELQQARECGNWGGAEPSELFLRARNPLQCLKSGLTGARCTTTCCRRWRSTRCRA
jgi:hypothetical protein